MTGTIDQGIERIRRHLTAIGAQSLTLFKGPYFERRLKSRWRACSVADAAGYADVLDRDPDERRRLLSALALGVTGFFRNPSAWIRLRELIKGVPGRPFRAWSAGCATGEETWSVAMLLADRAAAGGLGEWLVLGTDLDDRSLAIARRGEYSERAAAEIDAVLPDRRCSVADRRLVVDNALRPRVEFRRADLTGSPGPVEFDLVLCRNVLIYFTTEAQARVMKVLLDTLAVGGLLMLGKAELAAAEVAARLHLVDRRERIYRRAA